MPSIDFFPIDYATGREAFLAAAEARGATLTSHPIADRGPAGEELALDAAYLGPEQPTTVLAVSSGIHGAEGFAGSAVQRQLLEQQLDALDLPADAGLLLIHAINPYGFAHIRRVNESNVDLNRNFLAHPDEHVPNPDYDLLFDAINPVRLDDEVEANTRAQLMAYATEHGFPALQDVLTRGQYTHPTGVQFGGSRDEASNRLLREITASGCRGAQRVAWIDFHTGLGPFGEVEMISELPSSDPAYARGTAWFGAAHRSTAEGESASAHLCGTMEQGLAKALGAYCELTAVAAEFGTYEPLRVFAAMRADNWLHQHGDLDSEQGRAIKAELLEVFRPDTAEWKRQVLETGAKVIGQARDGLAVD